MRWLVRFAERRRISINEIFQTYTKKELDLFMAWERREITDNQRIEWLLAQGISMYINSNSKKTSKKYEPKDFIYNSNWLKDDQKDSENIIDEFMKAIK